MAIITQDYGSVGGGGFFLGDITPQVGTFYSYPTAGSGYIELGFVPKHVVVYMNYIQPSLLILHLDVENNIIYRSIGTTFEVDLTSTYSPDFYVSGTKLYYKAHAANYDVKTMIIAS